MKNFIIVIAVAILGTVFVILFLKVLDYNFDQWRGMAIGAISGGIFATIANKYLINK